MNDMLAALNAALMPISAVFMWFFVRYQYYRHGSDTSIPVIIFGWSLFCISIGIFMSSIIYYLADFDLIYDSTRYKLSVMPRSFFLAGLALGFVALEMRWRTTVLVFALIIALAVLTLRIVT